MNDKFILTPHFIGQVEAGLLPLARSDWDVNQPDLAADSAQPRMIELFRPLSRWVAQTIQQGQRPVSVAGDCCSTLGVMAGLQNAGVSPTLIWFDAHGDFNDWQTTPSGFLGGMPLAMLAGRGEQTMVHGLGLTPIAEERIILTDARDLDPGEKLAIENSAITHLSNVELLLNYPLPDGPLYVHFDVDVVDVAELPAVSYPAPGGPPAAALRRVFRHLAQTGRVTAVSVSAWNPQMDGAVRSQDVAMSLLDVLLGKS
ncbi:MAG: arginase family protein [Ardenticatenaceae bacterium]|nr:arginase family protein [Ardenticatenaceae bacterium]